MLAQKSQGQTGPDECGGRVPQHTKVRAHTRRIGAGVADLEGARTRAPSARPALSRQAEGLADAVPRMQDA